MQSFFFAIGVDADAAAVTRGAAELSDLGVESGGALLVHSSFRAVRDEAGSIEHVVGALMQSLGRKGTLLFPSLSYATVTRDHPGFDVQNTPSNIGAIPEYFRLLPVTRRSVHPTHSVSGYGVNAEVMLSQHHLDTTPVGSNSPFRALRDAGGQILMMGCGLRPNTSMHGVEEFAKAPYVLGEHPVEYTIRDGESEIKVTHRRHGFNNLDQRYDRIQEVLPPEALRRGTVFGAECWLIDAAELWSVCSEKIHDDPYFFVEETSSSN